MSMMNSQLEKLEENLSNAMHDFANVALQEFEPRCVFEKRTKCKIIKAQMQMVKDMMSEVASTIGLDATIKLMCELLGIIISIPKNAT